MEELNAPRRDLHPLSLGLAAHLDARRPEKAILKGLVGCLDRCRRPTWKQSIELAGPKEPMLPRHRQCLRERLDEQLVDPIAGIHPWSPCLTSRMEHRVAGG